MSEQTANISDPPAQNYREQRHHEVRKTRIVMVDGNIAVNSRTVEGGASARVFDRGYWGFASAPGSRIDIEGLSSKAAVNASAMSRFGARSILNVPEGSYRGEHRFAGKELMSAAECMELLEALHAYCREKYPQLQSSTFILHDEDHSKHLENSFGSDVTNAIQRAACYIFLTAEAADGRPVELFESISGKGSLADLQLSVDRLAPQIESLYQHLQAKRQAVPAQGGEQTIVLSPELAGMLAHEAMGHPCEADIVLGGAVTANLVGQSVGSDKITMVDYAHSYGGSEVLVPVYADDEGTPARDAVLIQDGVLTEFMNSRETAAETSAVPTGNARGYGYSDEPLVRMRNTAILPGTDKLDDIIAEVEHGYYLVKTGNGQADSTTEFMFGIDLGYEIRDGKLGAAIADTTVSGTAINMLKTVDAVSDDMHWTCSGYCGKKQPMIVSMGGPALRGKAHLGGE